MKPVAVADRVCEKLRYLLGTLMHVFYSLVCCLLSWGYGPWCSSGDYLGTNPSRDCTLFCCCSEYALHAFVHTSCHRMYTTYVVLAYVSGFLLNLCDNPSKHFSVNRTLVLESIQNYPLQIFLSHNSIINMINVILLTHQAIPWWKLGLDTYM